MKFYNGFKDLIQTEFSPTRVKILANNYKCVCPVKQLVFC